MKLDKFKPLALLLVRLAFGTRLIYGTIDNVLSWERMLEFEAFLAANGFPFPLISAIVSVYLQMLCGISWILGYQVKLSSALMAGNFLVAIVGVHLLHRDSYINTAPAIHLLCISLLLLSFGPGKYALDKN
jgi:putative oxidoreductase